MIVLPSAYLPPISWFASVLRGEPIFIEQYENYQKQTIRNRCTIDSPNGALHLSIPIDRSTFRGGKCLMKDVRISTHSDWQRQHWYAIETTYFNSPFFEYLQDDFRPFYEREWNFLIDFNEALIYKCIELLDIQVKIGRSEKYLGFRRADGGMDARVDDVSDGGMDARVDDVSDSSMDTRADDGSCGTGGAPYYQVFQHKHGFLPDLSIIDLIFNMGNESILILTK